MANQVAGGDKDLTEARGRLDRAMAALETRLKAAKAAGDDDLFAAPDRTRERALEAAAGAASVALGRAADEVRAILNGEG